MVGSRLDLAGISCLVVAGEAPVRELISALLRRHGVEVICVGAVGEALGELRARVDGCGALIADIQTAGEHLEELLGLCAGRPRFVLAPAPKAGGVPVGVDGAQVLSKPFSPPELAMTIITALAERYGRRVRSAGAASTGPAELDLCSGSGYSTCVVADAAGDNALIVGIDRRSDAIMLACGRVRQLGYDTIRFVVGDVARLPFLAGSFSAVHGAGSLERYGVVGGSLAAARAEVVRVACTPSDGREQTLVMDNMSGGGGSTLAQLRANNPDILAAAVVTTDGFAVEADTSAEIDEDSLAAMAADLLARASRSSQEFGNGALDELYARGEQGYLLVARAGSEQVLACLASADATVGLLLRDVRQAAAKIAD